MLLKTTIAAGSHGCTAVVDAVDALGCDSWSRVEGDIQRAQPALRRVVYVVLVGDGCSC